MKCTNAHVTYCIKDLLLDRFVHNKLHTIQPILIGAHSVGKIQLSALTLVSHCLCVSVSTDYRYLCAKHFYIMCAKHSPVKAWAFQHLQC